LRSLEKHVERQQSEKREAISTASASVKEEDREEELNVEELSAAGGEDLVRPHTMMSLAMMGIYARYCNSSIGSGRG